MSDEITITLTSASTSQSESISVSLSSTTLPELCEFAVALLGLPSSKDILLCKDGKRIFSNSPSSSSASASVGSAGIQNGDLILVMSNDGSRSASGYGMNSAAATTTARTSASTGGGLDFSSLLGSMGGASMTQNQPTAAASGGLTFNIPPQNSIFHPSNAGPMQWDGMTLDDAIERNPNPQHFISILFDTSRHPNMLKELNYHSPSLASRLRAAASVSQAQAVDLWRQQMQKSTLNSTLTQTMKLKQAEEMAKRLSANPNDEEAKKYVEEQQKKRNIEEQYRQMMQEFPESMGRVLMLYIDAEVNNTPIQAFVDSGAQSTIMSSKCAKECGLLDLVDTRFEGTAVGVGTGKILGRIHMAQMKIRDQYFPTTITVMDSEKGLGDKNMDFLLGLDMLKRFHCNIDLERNVLSFKVGVNQRMETPFLHEKDLAESKGGTKGFDAEKSNKEIEKMILDNEKSEEN